MFLGRTATEQGGHLGLMALTTGGQIEAITWNTCKVFPTALSAFVAQNYAARQITRVPAESLRTTFMDDIYIRIFLHIPFYMLWKRNIFYLCS